MLGISVYPTNENQQQILDYISLAAKYNVKRIFTNLLEVSESKEELIAKFKKINQHAHSFGMIVIIDVAPSVFETLNISYDDLSFFKDLEVDGLRLDEGFGGELEAKLTRNQYDLKIEINASISSPYIDQIIFNKPNKDNLITCHNFYPQRYTGLSINQYQKCNELYKKYNLRIATFITSQDKDAHGVWKDSEREPTLEHLRYLPMEAQVRHLNAINETDDLIISNVYATEQDFIDINKHNKNDIVFKLNLEDNLSEIEKTIIFEHKHNVRPDISEYMYRSTIPRITYKTAQIPKNNNVATLKRGDVVILNDNYGRYKGELHIVLKEMDNSNEKKNLVARISEEDLVLIDFLSENKTFKFII